MMKRTMSAKGDAECHSLGENNGGVYSFDWIGWIGGGSEALKDALEEEAVWNTI